MTAALQVAPGVQHTLDELFWNLMGRFERQALAQYRDQVKELQLSSKEACLDRLEGIVPPAAPLPPGALRDSMDELAQASAAVGGRAQVLATQGLVLEQVRRSVYAAVAKSPSASARTQELAADLARASAAASSKCVQLFSSEVDEADRFMCFVEASDELLRQLDRFGEEVDASFGDSFSVRFPAVVGDFVAELVPVCTSLGMDRRRVWAHLTCALMGF